MATYQTRVEDLIGSIGDTQFITDALTDVAREIVDLIPANKYEQHVKSTQIPDTGLALPEERIVNVTTDEGQGNPGYSAKKVDTHRGKLALDSSSIYYSTLRDSIYYVDIPDGKIYLITNGAKALGRLWSIPYPTVAYGDSTISNFPSECDSLVVLGAAVRGRIRQLTDKCTSLPSTLSISATVPVAPAAPDFGSDLSISSIGPPSPTISTVSYSDATNSDASASSIGAITVSAVSKADISGDVPTYTKPGHPAQVSFNDFFESGSLNPFDDSDPTAFSITAVPPDVPTITASTVSFSQAAPSYTKPTMVLPSAPSISDLSISVSIPVAPSLSSSSVDTSSLTAPTFTPPVMSAPDWSDTDTWISTEEDSEMLAARVQEIQAKVGEYSAKLQESQAQFQKENAEYQAELQIAIQDAQLESADDGQKLQKYGSEVQSYASQVSTEVQEYQQNLAGDLQVWQAERTTDLQEYTANIQNELNEFNKENAAYQAELQVSIQNAQLEDAEEAKKLQKYGAEVQEYQAEVGAQVQEYTQKLQRYQLEVTNAFQAWGKTESDNLQVFQLDIQNELNEFNKENARYQANIQAELAKHNSDLQKVLTQAQLDATDAQQEAALATDVDKFNKAQDQALALANAAKQIEDVIADNGIKIQKYSAELQSYQADVNKEVQDFTNTLNKEVQEYQNNAAIYNAKLQSYQAEIATEVQEFTSNTQRFSNEHALMLAELQALQSQYQQGLQLLIGGKTPQQQQ